MRWSRRGEGGGGGGGGGGKCWWWRHVAVLVVVTLVMSLVVVVETTPPARARGRGARGGGEAEGSTARLRPRPEWKKRQRKASECRLGKERYELGQEWSPNLGPPFGIWSCVKCVCEKVRRKRRVVGKVRCRNIKTECPKVTCVNPVLLPGMCCKACVTSAAPLPDPSIVGDERQVLEEDELTGRDFAVLLNGRTSLTPVTTTRVATGRLFLRRRTLHFSFLLEDGAPTPSSIQFLTESGEILEQLEPQPTPYEATNSRVCGTWTRVPKEYRALLLEEKLWVALNPEDDEEDVISGQVSRYVGVDTEVFSALLTPTAPPPDTSLPQHTLSGGGTAVISVDRRTDSLHVSLVFNGVFAAGETHNVSLGVELLPERALEPVTDTIVLPKVYSDVNRAELLTTLGERSLIRLTRGQVSLKIWSVAAPHLVLEGAITPRATCNVFCAVLSEPPPDASAAAPAVSPPPYGAGWALVTLSNDGTFEYQVFVQDLAVTSLTLETRHRRRHREVSDLTASYRNSWANGTYERPTYRDLDALLRGRVEVVVAGGGETGRRLQGTLSPVAVTEALRSPQPVLLASTEVPMAAAVWMAVDSACVTHYDVMVAGRPPGGASEPSWRLVLRENDHSWDPRFDLHQETLEEEVQGWELFAHTLLLMHVSLSRLGAEVSYLDLHLLPNTSTPQPLLSGRVRGVSVPSHCLLDPALDPNPGSRPPTRCTDPSCIDLDDSPGHAVSITRKCIDEDKRVFNNGKTWVSPMNSCSICMCTQGEIQCHDVMCHTLDCAGQYTPEGQCCPVCPGTINPDEDEMCELNEQRHHVGAKWHPFLAPKGFDKCVSCSCELNSSGRASVNCARTPCPELPCGPSEMEYVAESCCAQCRPPRFAEPRPTAEPGMVNEGILRTDEDQRNSILDSGGCLMNNKLYENGEEWHPRINTIGYYKCVVCNCKDSVITCDNVKCPTIQCHEIMLDRQECCPHCVSENSTLRPSRGKKRRNKPKSRRRNSG